jgi:hypothetical protein
MAAGAEPTAAVAAIGSFIIGSFMGAAEATRTGLAAAVTRATAGAGAGEAGAAAAT